MREVAPDIYRIEFPFADRIASVYVLAGASSTLVVDTGVDATPSDHLVPALEALGIAPERVRFVLATHADLDHHGGHGAMREFVPGAVFLCHEADRVMIEDPERLFTDRYDGFRDPHGIVEPESTRAWCVAEGRGTWTDLTVAGGERLHLGDDWWVELLHTPGHSRGHLAVLDARSGAAIIADAALGDGLPDPDGANVAVPTYRFVDAYLATIEALERLRSPLILTAHYPVLDAGTGADFLALSRTYAHRLDHLVRDALSAKPAGLTTAEVIAAVGPEAGPWPEAARAALVFPVAGHLERLAAFGWAEIEEGAGAARWRVAVPRR
jgi:glyoxylase-like metal-dependent hydrolase (beta-lactamase superfamily II)